MKKDELSLYQDDEGITTDLTLSDLGTKEIPCAYLDEDTCDDVFFESVQFIIKNEKGILNATKKSCKKYVEKFYSEVAEFDYSQVEPMHAYVYPDESKVFGFLFRWEKDIEHGIGIKFRELQVVNIGSAEVSFT